MSRSDEKLFQLDPREYALDIVDDGGMDPRQMLLCALVYMSHDDVRDMLDANELSPRFDEPDDEDQDEDEDSDEEELDAG